MKRLLCSGFLAAACLMKADEPAPPTNASIVQKLPPSAEIIVLKRLRASRLVYIRDLSLHKSAKYEYIGVFLGVRIDWGFERVYQQRIILRKLRSASDWSESEVFSSDSPSEELFRLSDEDIEAIIRRIEDK